MSEKDDARRLDSARVADHAICTKCGRSEIASEGQTLSRWCPHCHYMRIVYVPGESDEATQARLAAPFTDAERRELWGLPGTLSDPDPDGTGTGG